MRRFIITDQQQTQTDMVLHRHFTPAVKAPLLVEVFGKWLREQIQMRSFQPFLADDSYGNQMETLWFMKHDPQTNDMISGNWMQAAGGNDPHALYRRIIRDLWPIYATPEEVVTTQTVWKTIDHGISY